MKLHQYTVQLQWTGNEGSGTRAYRAYSRDHVLQVEGREPIACSSDPSFRGDASRYNPEQLLIGALAGCHMLWFLHLCTEAKIIVVEYQDRAEGSMVETADGGGKFTEVILKPVITLSGEVDKLTLEELHKRANELCFIAQSCNFPVRHEASYRNDIK